VLVPTPVMVAEASVAVLRALDARVLLDDCHDSGQT
jgi:hypothetical protein